MIDEIYAALAVQLRRHDLLLQKVSKWAEKNRDPLAHEGADTEELRELLAE